MGLIHSSFRNTICADNSNVDADLKERYPEQLFTNITVNGDMGEQRSVDVLVNTCSSFNFIHPDLVQQLGLEMFPAHQTTFSLGGRVIRYSGSCIITATMPNGFKFHNVVCMVRPKTSCDILMTLGHDFLRSFKYVSLRYCGPRAKLNMISADKNCKINISLNGIGVNEVFLDSASRQSVMEMEFAKSLNVDIFTEVNTQTLSLPPKPKYFCIVPLRVGGQLYERFKIRLVENLQIDVLLGIDFISLHKEVKVIYNGPVDPLIFKHQQF